MSDITLRQLRTFIQVVEQGSFNRCARFLDVSTVAISNHIKKLEDGLGHQLFKRSPGGVAVLTVEGKRDYRLTLKILSNYAELLDDSRNAVARRKIKITLEAFIFQCMQPGINQFKDKCPEIDIQYELEDVSYPEIVNQIKTNSIDIGYFYAFEDDSSLDSEFVCHVPLAIYVSKGHPLANKQIVSVKDLANFDVLKTSKKNYLNRLFDRAMEQIGLVGLSVALETDNMSIFGTSLDSGSVFTCLNQWVETTEYGSRIKRLRLEPSLPSIQLRQIVRPPLDSDPKIQQASQFFRASLESFIYDL